MPSREAMYDEIQTLRAKLKEADAEVMNFWSFAKLAVAEREEMRANLKEAERDRDIATRAVVAMQTQRDIAEAELKETEGRAENAETSERTLRAMLEAKGRFAEQQTRALERIASERSASALIVDIAEDALEMDSAKKRGTQ